MKKKINKFLQSIFITILTMTSLPLVANAQSVSDTIIIDRNYTYYVATTKYSDPNAWVSTGENIIRRLSDNNPIYCIQAHVKLIDGANVIGYDDTLDKMNLSNLTREQVRQIELTSYYGFGYGNHKSNDWYAATQLLIWEITDSESAPYPINQGDTTLTRSNYFDGMINEIRDLVSHHGDTVSFNNSKVEMKTGETIILKDTNNILSDFFNIESTDALDMRIEDDNLVIVAKKGYEGTINLIPKSNKNIPLIYDGANQKCLSRGDPTFISAKLDIKASTELIVNKIYGSSNTGIYKPEKNAKFELYNNITGELLDVLLTDENGNIKTYLGFGTYRLHQIEGVNTYKLAEDYIFTIDGTKIKEIVYLKNEKIKSDLEFTKTDISTDVGLENTTIEIYNSDTNELVYSGKTDSYGQIIIKNMEYGNYYIIEKEAPEGYEINNDKMHFSITEDGKVIKANIKDKKKVIEVPDTESDFNYYIIPILIILVGIGIIIILKTNKKGGN